MKPVVVSAAVLLVGAATAWAGPASAPAARAKVVPIGRVRVDLAARAIRFEAEVCLNEGVLEFLLVGFQTKTHESILHTRARPSHLHAGLLMLGLTPGKPARWSSGDAAGRFLPPAGPGLGIEVAWKDGTGRTRRVDAASWLTGADGRQVMRPREWIFVGSEVLPDGRYWAELDGEIISVANFASAVIDVPFRSSNANDQREYYANTKAIPPVGTKVEVIITPRPGAEKAPDARKLLEIDATGTMRIDGKVLTGEQLQEWGEKYIDRHERGMVVIRAAGRAYVHDVAAARLNLRLGGVREFDVQRVPVEGELLPRTAAQAAEALKRWNEKFANAHELIREPGAEARRTLDRIRLRLAELKAREKLLNDYAARLRASLDRYTASTQPAGGAPGPEK